MRESTAKRARLVGRFIVATFMIPVGVAIGVGGLVQYTWRLARGRHVTFGEPPAPSAGDEAQA